MKKISSLTATATSDGLFTNGSVATGVSPTILDAGWFNTVQNELVAIVQAAGIKLDDANDAQVLAALKKLCLSRSNPFGDIAADGASAILKALNNLGLGAGSALPVGVPVPWSLAAAPTGWLKCNGASFSATDYPQLAVAYPSLKLPDLRAEFLRGWDDGRGLDNGRALLTAQGDAIRNITGVQSLDVAYNGKSEGAFYNHGKNANEGVYPEGTEINDGPPVGNATTGASTGEKIFFDASRVVPVALENRPHNVAFNYIVRAI